MVLFCWLSTTVHGCRSSLFLCLNKFNYTFRFTQSVSVENLQVRILNWHFILKKHYTLLLWINNSHFLSTSEGKSWTSCLYLIFRLNSIKLLYWDLVMPYIIIKFVVSSQIHFSSVIYKGLDNFSWITKLFYKCTKQNILFFFLLQIYFTI